MWRGGEHDRGEIAGSDNGNQMKRRVPATDHQVVGGRENTGHGGREHQVPENRRFRRWGSVGLHLVQGANTGLLKVVENKNIQCLALNFVLRKVNSLSVVYQS